ncbi:MAG: TonB-dependent receptor [Glaciecola sp.]|jgi:iron complex outermembrane recepter protein
MKTTTQQSAKRFKYIAFKKSLLTAAMLSVFHSASAQEAQTAAEDLTAQETETEVIEVRGTRANLNSAQNLKRFSDTVVDSITAEDIGSLPDRSVLEAIQRLPGVSVERFAGPDDPDHFSVEGSGAIIRGLTQTRSEFNGRDSFSANSSRGLSFQDVSPELMGGVDIYKNQTADMIEGGIGGTVSLRTRKPFDSEGRVLAVNADYSTGSLSDEGTPTFSALYSDNWKVDDVGRVGVLFNYANSELVGESQGIQSDAYVQYWARDIAGAERFVGDDNNGRVWLPQGSNLTRKRDDRNREGFSAALQWESEDETLLGNMQYIRSDAQLSWHEHAVKYQGGYRGIDSRRTRALEGTEFTFDDQGLFQAGTLTNNDGWRGADGNNDRLIRAWETGGRNQFGQPFQFDSRIQDSASLVEDLSVNFRWLASDDLTLHFDAQMIKAEASVADMTVHTGAFAMQEYDTRGDTPTLRLIEPYNGYRDANPDIFAGGAYPGFTGDPAGDANYFQDPTSYFLRSAMEHYEQSEGDSNAFRIDGEYRLDSEFVTSVEAGVRYAKREQTVNRTGYNWGSLRPEFSGAAPAGWLDTLPAEFDGQFELVDWSDFQGGGVADIPGNQAWYATEGFVRNLMNNTSGNPKIDGVGDWRRFAEREESARINGIFDNSDVNMTTEKNQAIYIKANFEGGDDYRYSGNIGLRYVKLDRTANGYINFPDLRSEFGNQNLIPPGELANAPLSNVIVLDWVNDQVAQGNYANTEAAFEDPNNAWITNNVNYLPTEDLQYGNNADQFVEAATDYSAFLPSFNIKVELTDELIARFAASKAIALPDIASVRNSAGVGPQTVTAVRQNEDADPSVEPAPGENLIERAFVPIWQGGGGNPFLEPMESNQFDIALEWYFADVGQLSATYFHKDLKNYFIQGANARELVNPSNGISRTALFDTTTNGGKGKMDGLELAYQQFYDMLPAPFDGIGIQATYTYIDATGVPNNEIDYEDESWAGNDFEDTGIRVNFDEVPLQGQSRHTANFVLMYEKYDVSARLAYNWRSRYLITTRDVISKAPLWYDDHGQLDGSIFYNLNETVTVGVQFTNITNSQTKTLMQLNSDGFEAGRSWFDIDRRAAFVLRGNF